MLTLILPNTGTEDFLSCLSKAAIEKAAAGLGVLPRQRAKDTRAAFIEQVGEGAFVLPEAKFALTAAELLKFESKPRWHDWGTDDGADEDLDAATADGVASSDDILGEDYDREKVVGTGRYSGRVESETPTQSATMESIRRRRR
ncbi:hypothetical protein [Methylocapsa palsarum]|uniref:Uncharacterized protein n=1 Tax=Methylocapsa palsarum TaxID=1612308 RepID=A0A1I4CMD1_9HYPH|nr:hypothetical protein [Methylocapsa palsarum]SFK81091.1 hypothetical protein SAMN05444581_12323 [Methylocapsa palsarum]